MTIELIAQDNNSGKMYDITNAVKSVSWQTGLTDQPGSLEFTYLENKEVFLPYGSPISFKVDGQGIFFGYTFKRTRKDGHERPVVAYDQMRYLKNKDTYSANILANMTASQQFEKICKDFQLNYKIIDASSYKLGSKLFDNKTLFEIIQDGIDRTLVANTEWYMIRDNFGAIEFHNIANMKSNLVIGDGSLLTGYDFTGSIDSDTYNQIKLVQENATTGKREVYIIRDSSNISEWGTLQYFEKVNTNMNSAQITQQGTNLLKQKNRPTNTLKLTCLGDMRVYAGVGVVLHIEDLVQEGVALDSYYVVKSCTHKWSKGLHTMDVEVQVSV